MELLTEAVLWVAILGTAVVVSSWLWNTLGVAIASQGLMANTSALVFAMSQQGGLAPFPALILAIGAGAALGLAHLGLLKASNKEVLLIASVLLTFLWGDLWLSMPAVTGGSGGVVVPSGAAFALICVATAVGGHGLLKALMWPKADAAFTSLCSREVGLVSGVLGVPVQRLFIGGFVLVGCIFGLLGAAGASLTGIVTLNLFSTTWSLTVLALVVAPMIPWHHRWLTLPVLFIAVRWSLRDLLPPSIGSAQFIEFLFPTAVLFWSRAHSRA